MYLSGSQFSFCKEVGLLKENFSKELAFESIIGSVKKQLDCDPEYIKYLDSHKSEIASSSTKYVAVIYNYDINVDYVRGGHTYNTTVNGFGNSGAPSSLKVTTYYKNGDYTVLNDASECKYPVWNQNNLFTYEQTKNALKEVLTQELPSGTTSFKSKDWNVSAYFVPILYFKVNYNGQSFEYYYNLHNGKYHFSWPINANIEKNAKKSYKLFKLIRIPSLLVSIVATIYGFTAKSYVGIVALLLNLLMLKVRNKSKSDFKECYKKKPTRKPASTIIPEIIVAILTIIIFISTFTSAS